MASITEVFTLCQDASSIREFVVQLTDLYKKAAHEEFTDEFLVLLRCPLKEDASDALVNQILIVAVDFALHLNAEFEKDVDSDSEEVIHPFLSDLFYFLYEIHEASMTKIRQRCVWMLTKLLKGFTELSCSDDLMDRLEDVAKLRLRDIAGAVRAEAVNFAACLQDPKNSECPIIDRLLFLMNNDPQYAVRKAAVERIALNKKTIGPFLQRCQDINTVVRIAAYTRMAERIPIKCLTTEQRNNILKGGLNQKETSTIVVKEVIPAWYKNCKYDILKLIRFLDVTLDDKLVQKVINIVIEAEDLKTVMKKLDLDPKTHLMPIEMLTEENSFLWHCLCKYTKSLGNSDEALDIFDELTPTLTNFCEYINKFFEIMENSDNERNEEVNAFILEYLLELVTELDFCDTYGLSKLHESLLNMLKSPVCVEPMVVLFVKCLKIVEHDEKVFINDMIELVFNLLQFHDSQLVQPNLLSILKSLKITSETLKVYNGELFDKLIVLKKMFLVPCVADSKSSKVREFAMSALGFLCLRDLKEARSHVHYFIHAINVDERNVRIVALKCLIDILLQFGLDPIIGDTPESQVQESQFFPTTSEDQKLYFLFHETIVPLLDSKDQEMRFLASEGLAQLFIWGVINAPVLFARFVSMIYDSENDDDVKLKSMLSAFLMAYATSKYMVTKCIEDGFILAVQRFLAAPVSSSLGHVDLNDVLSAFLPIFNLISKTHKCGKSIFDEIAIRILHYMWKYPMSRGLPHLSKFLNSMDITLDKLNELLKYTVLIEEQVELDKATMKNIRKFTTKIMDMDAGSLDKTRSNVLPTNSVAEDDDSSFDSVFRMCTQPTLPSTISPDEECSNDSDFVVTGSPRQSLREQALRDSPDSEDAVETNESTMTELRKENTPEFQSSEREDSSPAISSYDSNTVLQQRENDVIESTSEGIVVEETSFTNSSDS